MMFKSGAIFGIRRVIGRQAVQDLLTLALIIRDRSIVGERDQLLDTAGLSVPLGTRHRIVTINAQESEEIAELGDLCKEWMLGMAQQDLKLRIFQVLRLPLLLLLFRKGRRRAVSQRRGKEALA